MKNTKFFLSLLLIAFVSSVFCTDMQEINDSQIQNEEVALGDTLVNLKDNLVQDQQSVVAPAKKTGSLNLKEVFYASPIIYTILFVLSVGSLVILLYTLVTFREKDLLSKSTIEDLKEYLLSENYEDALSYCENKNNLLSTMIASGICTRKHGAGFMLDTIKSEGKRATSGFWHRISLLNDVVIIAPMLGLLGTVIGMFYAFYDINRSIDSLSALFDGLGIAVGTTVAGLIVAIIAMCFYAVLKFRMIKSLNRVENEAISLGSLIKTKE